MDYFERYLDDGEDARVRLNAVKKSIFDYYANIKTDNSKLDCMNQQLTLRWHSLWQRSVKSQITMGELNTKYEHAYGASCEAEYALIVTQAPLPIY